MKAEDGGKPEGENFIARSNSTVDESKDSSATSLPLEARFLTILPE